MGRHVREQVNRDLAEVQGEVPPGKARWMELMSDGTKLLILDGRSQGDDRVWPLPPLLDRLERHGLQVQVLCASQAEDLARDPRALTVPSLKKRFLRPFAARWIWPDPRLKRPDLLHVLDGGMVDIAIALSETGQVPYVQTVADFATVARGLKLSRHWCRRLIATEPDLAHELVQGLGVPRDGIALIPHGIAGGQEPSLRKPKESTIPVIGAGGPLEEVSGLMIFTEAARLVVRAGYDVEFVIACAAHEQVALRFLTKQLGIAERVTVTDYPITGPDFWSVVDIYCQPAVSASTGRMLLLALSHALPCIATNVNGLRTLIDHGRDGLLVAAANPVALQVAITAVLDDPNLARRLGESASLRVRKRFDIEVEAFRLAELYREVTGNAK
jgi:glycosyltransferase involved in cell wall biosynthesis